MLSQLVKDELKAIVGEGKYFDNEEDLLLYSYDAFIVQGKPEEALFAGQHGRGFPDNECGFPGENSGNRPRGGDQSHRRGGAVPTRDRLGLHEV